MIYQKRSEYAVYCVAGLALSNARIRLVKGTTSTGFICSILLLCLPVLTLAFWAYLWFSIRKRADENMPIFGFQFVAEKVVKAGETVITQGGIGDYF